ncbi:MAG: glycosyltransferase family 2 protein [Gammaproteobacteria bacterium]
MSKTLNELSVVIPVYDEAANIAALLGEIEVRLGGRVHYEVIVVDDGSTDDTLQRLRNILRERRLPLRILRHARNAGQSAALRNGIAAARCDWIVTLDGDGQNDPTDIPKLLAAAAASSRRLDLVCGHRFARQDPGIKRLSSRLANAVRARLLDDGIPDTGCGLKLLRRQAFLNIPVFNHMHRFLPALIQRDGGEVISVAVNHRPRLRGQSKYGIHNRLWVGIVDLLGVLWLKRRAINLNYEEVTER